MLGKSSLKKAKIRGIYLALNTLIGLNDLKYSLPIADLMFLNFDYESRY